ncbi:hypothetical protein WJ0W_002911 [Paenibacillus melissococcoides]|uniref:Uncharacterized protein n=1 Tax=Paenibacillus melissococcoides TaxID=2912268 RepID=A0ABM9G260_9BACL|nr:hypothetical protein [Paenibacillus melissococcoides]CAH8245676.1 hypothetical protein WJ0W_002911 [Paenibacillus melissococcoides]CAH8711653.1 hypothetical protein WDD9_002989 [Paenibacillus melissococcoides]CAH8712419.1 hypothetical protein HTL2_003290 [Paenibacillus melissococcoides]
MKVDLNPVIWNEIMDICIDIEKGQIDHIDGTAKIQEAVEGYLKEVTTDVPPSQVLTLGIFQLFIGEHPAALCDSITDLIRFYATTKSKAAYKIVNRLTGETLLTNAWRYQIKKGE